MSACPPPGTGSSLSSAPAPASARAAAAITRAVLPSGVAMPSSASTATRSPRTLPSTTSDAEITESTSARSATVRAIGPICVRGSLSGPSGPRSSTTPKIGTRPAEGFKAATPQKCAGRRTLAPESVPSANAAEPDATAAAEPPLDPPAERSSACGLFVRPKTSLSVSIPPPHGGRFVLPTTTAPAARSRATTTASAAATTPRRSGTPTTSGRPPTAMLSLTANGTPRSGPASGSA